MLQSYADTYTLNPIPFGNSTAYGPPSTFTVLPFDGSLGSLLSTTITWETSGAGGATLVNSSTCGGCCGRAAVALLGPRQVGKTTLALQLTKTLPSLDLDLESTALRQRFTCRRPWRHGAGKVPCSG